MNLISKDEIKKGQTYLPIKGDERLSNIEKYGGYNKVKGAYFSIVEHILRNKKVLTIEPVPIYLIKEIEKRGNEIINDYYINTLNLISPKIIVPRVLMKTHVKIDGFNYTLNGKTNDYRTLHPIEEPHWDIDQTKLIKYVVNLSEKSKRYDTDITTEGDRANIIELIDLIQTKLNSKPFNKRLRVPEEAKEFNPKNSDLSTLDLAIVTKELLKLVTPVYGTIDLKLIGGKGAVGSTYINRDISKLEEFIIIDESPTGFYKKEKDVLKLWDGDK